MIYSRLREHKNEPGTKPGHQPLSVKVKHLHAVEAADYAGLSAFIDDEPDAATDLRHHGFNAQLATDLAPLATDQLQALLAASTTPQHQQSPPLPRHPDEQPQQSLQVDAQPQ